MRNDLTQGNIYKRMIAFTIPILLSNLLQQLYSIADHTIVGRLLGKEALAAVGASFQISNIILAVAMGLTLGMGILISNAYGAKKMYRIQKIVDTGMVMCMILSVLITILGVGCAGTILGCFQVPDAILQQATLYFAIICSGTIPSFGYNAIVNYLRGVGDSKTPLLFLIISSILNIVLDVLFISVVGAGVAGAAAATVISQIAAYTAASKIDGLSTLPAVNIGKAMSNVIAQNRGANREDRVKEGAKAGIVMTANDIPLQNKS